MTLTKPGSSGGTSYPGPIPLTVIWTVVGALAFGRHYLVDGGESGNVGFQLLLWLTCFYPWIAVCPLIFRLEHTYPLGKSGWRRSLTVLSVAGIFFAYAVAELSLALSLALEALQLQSFQVPHRWWAPRSLELFIQFLVYAAVVASAYAMRNLMQLRRREREAAQLALEKSELEASLRQAELETLRTRLNPHFLFNCLQNISVLTEEDPKTAKQMLCRLAELLRIALRQNTAAETTLGAEIALTKSYIAVEQVRFSDRLSVLFDLSLDSMLALVPTFVLQPLVENAIVHGLRGNGAGIISIRSVTDSRNIVLTVTDNGVGLPNAESSMLNTGIGLGSVCERLAKMYPQNHSFSIRPLPEGGTEVTITLPLTFEREPFHATSHEETSLIDRR
jgi:two-component system, LytTR family, sensor kinase